MLSRKLMLAPCAGEGRDRDATRTRSLANRALPSGPGVSLPDSILASKSRANLASALPRPRVHLHTSGDRLLLGRGVLLAGGLLGGGRQLRSRCFLGRSSGFSGG